SRTVRAGRSEQDGPSKTVRARRSEQDGPSTTGRGTSERAGRASTGARRRDAETLSLRIGRGRLWAREIRAHSVDFTGRVFGDIAGPRGCRHLNGLAVGLEGAARSLTCARAVRRASMGDETHGRALCGARKSAGYPPRS